jgi:ATP-binding cassette subfamily B protein
MPNNEQTTEQQAKRGVRKGNAKLIWRFLKGSKYLFLGSILASAVSSLADMLDPQIIRAAIDNAIGGKPSEFPVWVNDLVDRIGGFAYLGQHLWIMAAAILAVALLRVAASYCSTVIGTKASETLVKTMRDTLFGHIERLPFSWHMKNHTGDIIQRCTSDVDRVRRFVAEQLTSVLRISVYLVLSLYFMFSMNTGLTLISIVPLPFILLYSVLFRKQMDAGFRDCDENEGKVSAMVQENLTGVRVVRAFGREKAETDRFEKQNEYYTSLWVKMGKLLGRFFSTQDFLSGVQILLVFVFGAVFAINGRMTPGEYVAFISYNSMLIRPIRMLGRMISEMSKAGVSIGRIGYIMDAEEEKDREGAGEAPMDRDIHFEHITFAYENCPDILHDISFDIKAGTTLGILGGTGSGKSTLMLLLDRMYDLEPGCGTIRIGDTDIRDIRSDYLRDNISMVLQEPFLFSRTISENIGIASEGITLEEIRSAAQAACLDDTVTKFSQSYDTFVGERGVTLSGGQKQRAAIARALTKNAPIMIFDDSLSAVDTETDAKIRSALQERFGTATIILISHRITTLSKADRIIVLENGRITEQGTPDELKSNGGIYQRIYEIQSGVREGRHITAPGTGGKEVAR